MRSFVLVALAVTTAAAAGHAAFADEPPPTPPIPPTPPTNPDADRTAALFDAGREALAAHRAAEACDKFTAALVLDPEAAGIMLNLGLCNRELDRLATALRWFRKAESRGAENGLAEIEAAAKQAATEIAARVATADFSLAPVEHAVDPVASPAITLDAAPIALVDLAHVELDAGHHVVEVTTPAGTDRQAIEVVDGDAKKVVLVVPHRERHVSVVDRGTARRHLARRLGEVSAGTLGAVLVAGLIANHVASEPATSVDTQARLHSTFEWGVTPIAAAGFVGAAIAGYLYATAPGVERREQIVPVIDSSHVGLTVTTHF